MAAVHWLLALAHLHLVVVMLALVQEGEKDERQALDDVGGGPASEVGAGPASEVAELADLAGLELDPQRLPETLGKQRRQQVL